MRKTLLAAASAIAVSAAASAASASDFTLSSTDIAEGQQLSSAHVFQGFGCEGGNVSPQLSWSGAPAGTKSFVVAAYDPDAPTGSGWWHWKAFNIPASITSLPRGAGKGKGLPDGAVETTNVYGVVGFGGACPPPGEVHRYIFTVYALGVERLEVPAASSNALVGFMTRANALASASITAVYNR